MICAVGSLEYPFGEYPKSAEFWHEVCKLAVRYDVPEPVDLIAEGKRAAAQCAKAKKKM